MANPKFRKLIRRVNWYPPYLGMGVRVKSVNDEHTRFVVELRQRWYNRNLFGTHFGGSLYAMADPFYVFIVMMNLGRDYIVWDKAASIEFDMLLICGMLPVPKEEMIVASANSTAIHFMFRRFFM